MKRFAMILLAAVTLVGGVGIASAQMHGSAAAHGGGGGGWHGGGGGGWHGGGGGGWHGSGGWHGGGNWHGGGYWRGGWFGWGWGWGWPGYYPYYPYYSGYYYPSYPYYPDAYPAYGYSAPTYSQQDTPAYTERSFSDSGQYLYYCPDPAGYYPQVPSCAKGWLRVLPPDAPGTPAPAQH